MAVSFRADAAAGTGAGAASSTTITVPASAQVGDVAVIGAVIGSGSVTLTTPSGWAVRSGPDAQSSANSTSWLLSKTIAAGDPGSTVTLAFSASQRTAVQMTVLAGATETGLSVTSAAKGGASSTDTVPSVASVPGGSGFLAVLTNRTGTASQITCTVGSPYTVGANGSYATSGAAAPNVAVFTGYQLPSSTGSLGGENKTTNVNTVGVMYAVTVPAGGAAKLRLGSAAPSALYVGAASVQKVFLGSGQVWP